MSASFPISPEHNLPLLRPNKLSQYMAAGLSIICNDLDFVKSVVVGNGIGTSVNFNNQDALRTMNSKFVNSRPELADMSRKARNLYRESCNWQTVSRGMYERLRVESVSGQGLRVPNLMFLGSKGRARSPLVLYQI